MSGDPFINITTEMNALHVRKGKDYGSKEDPFANIRHTSDSMNLPHYQAAFAHIFNKTFRLRSFIHNGNLTNEGVEDTLLDLANYSVIALIMYREYAMASKKERDKTESRE